MWKFCQQIPKGQTTMKALKILAMGAPLLISLVLLFMLFDGAVSLDHSRSQNQFLQRKCKQLSLLASEGIRGKNIQDLVAKNSASMIVKVEGSQLRLNDIVLQTAEGTVKEVLIAETCED